MIKLFLCIVLLFCSGVIGVHFSRRLMRRRDILIGFEVLFHRASIQIAYNAGSLCEVFSDNFADHPFTPQIPFQEQWESFVNSFSYSLAKEDIAMLTDFTREFGTADSEAQRRHIALYSELLREHIGRAQEDIRTKSKMVRVIPLSVGMVIALLLI